MPRELIRGTATTVLSIEELSTECGVHPGWVRKMVVLGLVEPEDADAELYPVEASVRIERILRLRRDLGINYSGLALVLDLLDRVDRLEARLRAYEGPAGFAPRSGE